MNQRSNSHRPVRAVEYTESKSQESTEILKSRSMNEETQIIDKCCPEVWWINPSESAIKFQSDSPVYLLYDPLLHHIWHDLEVDGPRDHVGRMSPEMRVSVRQNPFNLLDLKI